MEETTEQKPTIKIHLLGLDGAGKTTILYKVKRGLNEDVSHYSIPTIGYNEETIDYRDVQLAIWDVGGLKTVRALRNFYLNDTKVAVYVVDASDRSRVREAFEDLTAILANDQLKDAPLLICANKQDEPNAMTTGEIIDIFNPGQLRTVWNILPTTAIKGVGLYACLDWIVDHYDH